MRIAEIIRGLKIMRASPVLIGERITALVAFNGITRQYAELTEYQYETIGVDKTNIGQIVSGVPMLVLGVCHDGSEWRTRAELIRTFANTIGANEGDVREAGDSYAEDEDEDED